MQAVASELLSQGLTANELSQLEDAWLPLLDAFPWGVAQADALKLRGRTLFRIGARLLGSPAEVAEAPGELWSLIDGAQHCSDPQSRSELVTAARGLRVPGKIPANLRALTIIAAVAVSNIRDPGSGIARGMAAAKHRLTGRIPQL